MFFDRFDLSLTFSEKLFRSFSQRLLYDALDRGFKPAETQSLQAAVAAVNHCATIRFFAEFTPINVDGAQEIKSTKNLYLQAEQQWYKIFIS